MHIFGGHLEGGKTKQRLMQRFYWPGVSKEVGDFLMSSPVCQKSVPITHFRSFLGSLYIIEVPFNRFAKDLVEPLLKSTRGQYIGYFRLCNSLFGGDSSSKYLI